MRVLIGCERSGRIRDAFRKRGHEAFSCDLAECDPSPYAEFHLHCDIRKILGHRMAWDLFIVHPDCTYLCASGLHWNKRRPERESLTMEALAFIETMARAPIERIAIENPRGCIGTRLDLRIHGFNTKRASQTIQPWQFGDDASKATDLWLKNLPLLRPTRLIAPRYVCQECATTTEGTNGECPHCGSFKVRERWANQTNSGQNRLGPSEQRAMLRAATYPGIAEAIAEQWGSL